MAFRLCLLAFSLVPFLCFGQEWCVPEDGCSSDNVALLSAGSTGSNNHYYIGGMFGVHERGDSPYVCGSVRNRGLINMEAFFWAIQNYPSRFDIGDTKIGGFAMDSCSRTERTLENLYSFETCRTQYTGVNPRNTLAYVGPDRSGEALATAVLLQDMNRTQISHSSTSPELSNDQYTYFLRTVPSDANDVEIMIKLMMEKDLKYVIALYQDTKYGMAGFHEFSMRAQAMNICITFQHALPGADDAAAWSDLMDDLEEVKSTRFVVLFADAAGARMVLEKVEDSLPEVFTFIGTSSWGTTESVIQGLVSSRNAITMKLDTDMYSNSDDVDAFWEYFLDMKPSTSTHNPWFNQFWEETFGCKFIENSCDESTQSLRNVKMEMDVYVPYTLRAVEAIIRGVKSSAAFYCTSTHLCSDFLNLETRGQKIYEGISNAVMSNGSPFFRASGDADASANKYKVYQSNGTHYLPIYNYDPQTTINNGFSSLGNSLTVLSSSCPFDPCPQCNEVPETTTAAATTTTTMSTQGPTMDPQVAMDALIAKYFQRDQEFTGVYRGDEPGQERTDDEKMTRFEIGHKWIIAIGVLAGLGILCVLIFEIYILYKLMGTKLGKQWRTMWLGQLLLFSIFLCYLVLFAYLPVPTKATCGITRFGVGVAYAMCFAVLLVKLMVLLTSKSSSDTLIPGDIDSPNYLRGIYQFLMFVFVVGVQVVIAAQWLIQVPPDAVKVISNNGDPVWICNHYTWQLDQGWNNMTLFVRTDFENHLISLTYVMFLILITTIVAMKAHGIITNHRESIFIGIAAGFSIPVWVSWGLVGGLNKDHPYSQEFGDACIAFGLCITATLILFSMFLPKVRQLVNMGVEGIYLEDDRDTYYAGSVIMAPPSYKSRPNSVYMSNGGYADPIIIGDEKATYLKHPGSTYSAPVHTIQRPVGSLRGTGKVLQMTGDLTGKRHGDSRRPASEVGYATVGNAYRKSRSESGGGTLRKSTSAADLGAL